MTLESRYEIHGLNVMVSTNEQTIQDAVQARLRHFATDRSDHPDLSLRLHLGGEREPTSNTPPGPGPDPGARLIGSLPIGSLWYHERTDQVSMTYGDTAQMLCDPRRGRARIEVAGAGPQSIWAASHLLFTPALLEMMRRRGLFGIHAGGLVIDGRAILLAGASGAGKTTLTLALLRAGFGFMGDDTLFLSPDERGLRIQAFPDEVDVTPGTAQLFPELGLPGSEACSHPEHKRPVRAEIAYGLDVAWEARPGILIFPRVAHADHSVLTPMGPQEALVELAPNVLLTDPRAAQAHFDAIAELARSSRCYRLETGRDLEAVAQVIRSLVESDRAATRLSPPATDLRS
jgi:hypothetical protein